MLTLRKLATSPSSSHEALFVERYQRLYGWLLHLTEGDRELAEDLVHDAFIQFTFTRPELKSIHNLDAYLYGLVRNLHLSQVRRTANNRLQPLSILDYDSSEIGLRMTDPRDQMQVQDELRRICHYGCVRKESAWAGSVLILRFFHGYYPSEISQVLRNSRSSVDCLLKCARREARVYLDSPGTLGFMKKSPTAQLANASFARPADDFLIELRQMILGYRSGDCLPGRRLQRLYRAGTSDSMSCADLAHIVSCERCLDVVNNELGLAKLAERYPTDTMGKDASSKRDDGDSGGPGDGVSGGGATGGDVAKSRRRAKAVFEHKPQELHIAVNGYVLGSQKVNSKLNEQTLDVNLSDPINFVEVFSEQRLRLLFSCVDTPPEGPHRLTENVELSDGRRLALTLRFRTPWPSLHVAYTDPTFNELDESVVASLEKDPAAPLPIAQIDSATRSRQSVREHALALVALGRAISSPQLWLRPGIITAIVAVLLVAAFLFVNKSDAPLSASEILRQSLVAEQTQLARADQVLHRTINLEEKNAAGAIMARRRIDVWHSAERGITARRIYDEENQLVAGDWRRADGVQTLYRHGSRPQLQIRNPQSAIRNFENAWQQDLTTQDFAALVKNGEALKIDESPTAYVLTYHSSGTDGLRQATLVLSRPDLHATEQTFVVRQGTEERIYRYLETSFERRPTTAVAPAVFEPDAVLLGKDAETGRRGDAQNILMSPSLPVNTSPLTVSPALEMEVVRLLDQVGAFGGEQVSVTRTPEGALLVEGVLDTDQRKRELLSALAPVSRNLAVKIRIETQDDAIARRAKQRSGSVPSQITLDQVQVETRVPAAYAELRKYFSARGVSGDQSEREINAFVDTVLGQSMRARQQARALKQLAGRLSQEELRMLDDDSRAKWRAMILRHVRSFQREADGLRRKLDQVFPAVAVGEGLTEITSDADLVKAIDRLFALWATVDENVRASFSIASSGNADIAVRRPQFWQSLKSAEALAFRIQNMH